MSIFPQNIKQIHIMGIGGIGMSAIAEILHHMGYVVTGSDSKPNNNTVRLSNMGIKIMTPQLKENIIDPDLVVMSSAIKSNNPERQEVERKKILTAHRSHVLSEILRTKHSICVSGTHGKTTTTSLIANVFDEAGQDPLVVNGGIINRYKSNVKTGNGAWAIAEADESDGSMNRMHTTHAVVTNIDPEHMDHYKNIEELHKAFSSFINDVPFYGYAVLCFDHPVVREIAQNVKHNRIISYGFDQSFDISADNLHYTDLSCTFDVHISPSLGKKISSSLPTKLISVVLSTVGKHNVQNALSAIAIGFLARLSEEQIRKGLSTFEGVQRRFTLTGNTPNGAKIIDDYAHHPVEINALIDAARKTSPSGRIIAVMQPHKYSRLHDLFNDFSSALAKADEIMLTPVYTAGEEPIEGVNSDSLCENIKRVHHHQKVSRVNTPQEVATHLKNNTEKNDIVLCIGAGDITQWAYELPDLLAKTTTSFAYG